MRVIILEEHGYESAVLGFSLSYNTSIERTKQILPKYAFGVPGENKFLEQMVIWLDVTMPRYWWQEADTYRVGTSKQSESTMHTITKAPFTADMFDNPISVDWLQDLNMVRDLVREKMTPLYVLKNVLPEGFLQRRIWMLNYKTLQNIYVQRIGHRLPHWRYFLEDVLKQIEHPEFIIKEQ